MTEQTHAPSGCAGVAMPAQTYAGFGLPVTLDRLVVAAQAARLAVDMISEAERTSREADLAPADLARNWRAANLLVQAAFDALSAEVLQFEHALNLR